MKVVQVSSELHPLYIAYATSARAIRCSLLLHLVVCAVVRLAFRSVMPCAVVIPWMLTLYDASQ